MKTCAAAVLTVVGVAVGFCTGEVGVTVLVAGVGVAVLVDNVGVSEKIDVGVEVETVVCTAVGVAVGAFGSLTTTEPFCTVTGMGCEASTESSATSTSFN